MNRTDEIAVLNRLLRILYRSLPVYLQATRPWIRRGTEKGLQTLAEIAADQRSLAVRLAEAIHQRDGQPEFGQFPVALTAMNDLSLEYLLHRALAYQRRDVEAIRRCADQLAETPDLGRLARAVLNHSSGHLTQLEGLLADEAFAGQKAER